jgi:hypothetical protein
MKKALLVFNGIQFPFYLVDHALDWATKNNGSLQALFVHSKSEPCEGYLFPSDIDPAEDIFDKEDAEKSNENVIRSQIKLFLDMAAGKNVPAQAQELINPSLPDMEKITEPADILFVDAEYDKAFLLAGEGFHLKALLKVAKCPVETVNKN